MNKQTKNTLEWIFLLFSLVLMLAILFSSCKTKTVYIPIETIKTEYKDRLKRDSIYLMDSVFADRWQSGDTIYLTKEKYKYIYRDKLVRDSVYIQDTIKVPYPVIETKTVKEPYNWYEKSLLALGCISIGFLGFRIFKWIKK